MTAKSNGSRFSGVQRLAVLLLAGALTIGGLALAAKPSGGGGGGGGGGGKTAKPAVSVSPTSLSFGEVEVGTTSAAQSVSVKNTGKATLTFSNITISSPTVGFAFTKTCGATLAAGATCSVNVTFTPASVDPASTNLVIVSDASNATTVAVALSGTGKSAPTTALHLGRGGGDSIMRGYNADCTSNTGFFDFICYGAGDKPQYSFFDGSSSTVLSIEDRYIQGDTLFTANQNTAASGSEMTDPAKNNFASQATDIVNSVSAPVRVFIELGGNDICNRGTVEQLYNDSTWEIAVRAGLNTLVKGEPGGKALPSGSTVMMVSVPRVQDLRAVGFEKQRTTSGVNCENFWKSYKVCLIATASDANLADIEARQQAYNAILVRLAAEYNGQSGIEVVTDYDPDGVASSVGSYSFQPGDINGGDCFHPSIQGQNKLSDVIWNRRPSR